MIAKSVFAERGRGWIFEIIQTVERNVATFYLNGHGMILHTAPGFLEQSQPHFCDRKRN